MHTIAKFLLVVLLIGLILPTGQSSRAQTEPAAYLSFAINVHDWVHLDDSAQTISNLIDLFEEYGVRGDFYLTAPMTRFYAEHHPAVLERLCSSAMTISYHIRPPHPVYPGFDQSLQDLSEDGLFGAIYAAETQRLDLSTGELIPDEIGGYLYVAQQCGRFPVALGIPTSSPQIKRVALEVYTELGAQMVIFEHETGAALRQVDALWTRPSDFSITRWAVNDQPAAFWWNMLNAPIADEYDPVRYLQTRLTRWQETNQRPAFVTMLIHENNFLYGGATPWANIYYTDKTKQQPLSPPYDLAAPDASHFRSQQNRAAIWQAYRAVVSYAASDPLIKIVTSEDIVELAESQRLAGMH